MALLPILLVLFSLPQITLAGWSDQLSILNSSANLPNTTLDQIIFNFLLYLLAIFTVLSVLSFVIYGLMFLFGGASKELADSARKGVSYSITGIVVGLSGYIIIRLIDELLRGSFSLYF